MGSTVFCLHSSSDSHAIDPTLDLILSSICQTQFCIHVICKCMVKQREQTLDFQADQADKRTGNLVSA